MGDGALQGYVGELIAFGVKPKYAENLRYMNEGF